MIVPQSPVDDGQCVGCGPESAIGLHMQFERNEDGSVTSRLIVPTRFQGWRDVVHGGIVALILDEAMAYATAASGAVGMTAQLSLRFRSEVIIGTEVVVRGAVLWRRKNIIAVEASLRAASGGALLASADARFISRGDVEPGTRLGLMSDSRAGG